MLINFDYQKLIENEQGIINYLAKNSETFSITTIKKRPYSQNPPIFKYDNNFNPYAIKYFYRNEYPKAMRFIPLNKHGVLVFCLCNKNSRKSLLEVPNLFAPLDADDPENLCFYRNNNPFFVSIPHEKLAYVRDPNKKDIEAFIRLGQNHFDEYII